MSNNIELSIDRINYGDGELMETNWVVITGAPSSGKSTIIKLLSSMGYDVCHDVAREVIKDAINDSGPIDEHDKQLRIVKVLLDKYNAIPKDKLVFMDYGMPDNLVFQAQAGFKSHIAEKASKLIRYRAVFLLEPLPIEYDGFRMIDCVTQDILYKAIFKQYKKFGYDPIKVPREDIQSRLYRILDYLKEDIICHY